MGADEMQGAGLNVAEIIPYGSFKEMIRTVKQEVKKNRYVEVWDEGIYSVGKWQC